MTICVNLNIQKHHLVQIWHNYDEWTFGIPKGSQFDIAYDQRYENVHSYFPQHYEQLQQVGEVNYELYKIYSIIVFWTPLKSHSSGCVKSTESVHKTRRSQLSRDICQRHLGFILFYWPMAVLQCVSAQAIIR